MTCLNILNCLPKLAEIYPSPLHLQNPQYLSWGLVQSLHYYITWIQTLLLISKHLFTVHTQNYRHHPAYGWRGSNAYKIYILTKKSTHTKYILNVTKHFKTAGTLIHYSQTSVRQQQRRRHYKKIKLNIKCFKINYRIWNVCAHVGLKSISYLLR